MTKFILPAAFFYCSNLYAEASKTYIAQAPKVIHADSANCNGFKNASAVLFYPSTDDVAFKTGDDFYLVGPKGAVTRARFGKIIDNEDCLNFDSIGSYTAATLSTEKKFDFKSVETMMAIYKAKPQRQQVGSIEKLKTAGATFQTEINKHLGKLDKKEDQTVYEVSVPGVFQKALLVTLVFHKPGEDDEKHWTYKTLFFDNRGRHPKLSYEEETNVEPLAITHYDRAGDRFDMLVSSGTNLEGKYELRSFDTKTLQNKVNDVIFEWGD